MTFFGVNKLVIVRLRSRRVTCPSERVFLVENSIKERIHLLFDLIKIQLVFKFASYCFFNSLGIS